MSKKFYHSLLFLNPPLCPLPGGEPKGWVVFDERILSLVSGWLLILVHSFSEGLMKYNGLVPTCGRRTGKACGARCVSQVTQNFIMMKVNEILVLGKKHRPSRNRTKCSCTGCALDVVGNCILN